MAYTSIFEGAFTVYDLEGFTAQMHAEFFFKNKFAIYLKCWHLLDSQGQRSALE